MIVIIEKTFLKKIYTRENLYHNPKPNIGNDRVIFKIYARTDTKLVYTIKTSIFFSFLILQRFSIYEEHQRAGYGLTTNQGRRTTFILLFSSEPSARAPFRCLFLNAV